MVGKGKNPFKNHVYFQKSRFSLHTEFCYYFFKTNFKIHQRTWINYLFVSIWYHWPVLDPLWYRGGLGVCDLIRTNGLDSITDGLTVKLDLLQLD